MGMNERVSLAALSAEMGAKAVLLPFESVTRRFLTGRASVDYTPVLADKDAEYDELFQINIEKLVPQIAGPGSLEQVGPVADLEGQPVTQVIVGGGSSGRFDDLRMAAEIVKGRQVHKDCRLLVAPASRLVYLEALKKGLIRILAEAGAVVMHPGSPVQPVGLSSAMAHERCLTTGAPRERYHGTGTPEIYICSAATAAASALNAAVTDPIQHRR
jgi:3-isopropylmalate/(R)-2-methylmalate dehydratase large subunit